MMRLALLFSVLLCSGCYAPDMQFPADVWVPLDATDDEREGARRAVHAWNEGLGETVFVLHEEAPTEVTCDSVYLVHGQPADPTASAHQTFGGPELLHPCYAIIEYPRTTWAWHSVLTHELGHVLGVEHSSDPTDLMHRDNPDAPLSDWDLRQARNAL